MHGRIIAERRALPLAAVFLACALGAAQAQEAVSAGALGVTSTDDGARVIYGEAYFNQYSVVTVEDLLRRIPGIQNVLTAQAAERRGFGQSGDQLLINGKRLSGKTNDVVSAMRRIQARQVDRIEVIRGSVAGLGVRSDGLVVNVVLKETLVTSYGAWETILANYSGDTTKPGGQLNYAGDYGGLSYLFSARIDPSMDRIDRDEVFFNPSDVPFERQFEIQQWETTTLALTGTLAYTFNNGDLLNVNGRYADDGAKERQSSDQFALAGDNLTPLRNVLILDRLPNTSWEIGGDYEHSFPSGNVFRALFLFNTLDFAVDRTLSVTPPSGVQTLQRTEFEDQKVSESIVRGTYEFTLSPTKSLETGGEVAVNTVDKRIALAENQGGMLVNVPLFNADSDVKETRAEAFASLTWQPQPRFLLKAATDIEYSRIKQVGSDISRSRSFLYAKPRIDLRYDVTPLFQVRAVLERTISQLEFEDFVASFSADDNRIGSNFAGNPDLVPEKAWELTVDFEKRFAGDKGTVLWRLALNEIEDRLETIPVVIETDAGDVVVSAPGNLGNARSYATDFRGSLRLDDAGIRGGVFEWRAATRNSRVRDPFTNRKRDFSDFTDYNLSGSFRQDTSWHDLSYGFTVSNNGPVRLFDLDFRQKTHTNADLSGFIELQPIPNVTARLQADRIFRRPGSRERLQFDGSRGDGIFLRREERTYKIERVVQLILRGVF